MISESCKVLLIEDNPDDFFLIQEVLEVNKSFKLTHAETLEEALKLIDKNYFDVILLDLGLPDSEGFDTFIQTQDHAPETAILILTGLQDEELGVRAVREGAQDYLLKGHLDCNPIERAIRYSIERKKTEKLIKKSAEEKEMLLKEIHHRVKNNLMIISSLLNLQSQYLQDKKSIDIFKESQNRARSMALIHERLYQSTDLKRIDFGDYIRTLSRELFRTFVSDPKLIKLKINVEDIFLDINTAIPLGLITNELITNSFKHAFPDGRSGNVIVNFHSKNNQFILTVSDDGIGFPENLDFKNTESLGLQLVNSLTDQIDAEIELYKSNGTKFELKFKETKLY